jgi:hypothetical protein
MGKLTIQKSRASGNLKLPERMMALQLPSNKSRDLFQKEDKEKKKVRRVANVWLSGNCKVLRQTVTT